MARKEDEVGDYELAAFHAALGHPVRVVILRILRRARRLPLATLRHEVVAAGYDIDTRTLQHHVHRMYHAGILDLAGSRHRYEAVLVRDLSLRIRAVPGVVL